MSGFSPADARLEGLLRLSAALGTPGRREWGAALEAASVSVDPLAIEEAILQAHLFAGFPTVLNVLTAWRMIHPGEASIPDPSVPERRELGEALCRRVYGGAYGRLRDHVARLHPDLDRWAIEEGYGKTLSRPGLSTVERELCVVALLAAAGQAPQLRSHLRGSLNVGASPGDVEAALGAGLEERSANGASESDLADLRAAWTDVRQRAGVE